MSTGRFLTVEEIAELAALPQRIVRRLVTQGVIDPVTCEPEPLFRPETVLLTRKMIRLRRDLGVNFFGARLALELGERIAELERELQERFQEMSEALDE